MTHPPDVSVIVPAYRAEATIARAVASVQACGLAPERVEIVIASDDGRDYAALLSPSPSLRFVPPGPVGSGAGPARNRAMDAARAEVLAFLDSDDCWAPDYLSDLLPRVSRSGIAFGPTAVIEDAAEILRLPDAAEMTMEVFGSTGASFHPVLTRQLAGRFGTDPSQDILFAVEALARAGGRAPVGRAPYRLHLHAASATRAGDFSARLDAAYAGYARAFRSGTRDIPAAFAGRAAAVFDAKRALNAAFMADGMGRSFYRYLADRRAARPAIAAE